MEKTQIIKALEELHKQEKRKFVQSFDLIVTLKDVDVKVKPVDAFAVLPHSRGKKIKVCALVGQELAEQAAKTCDFVIRENDFVTYKDKKKLKNLARSYDFFVAQVTLMPQVAAVFGRVLGPRGRMPNPKSGCVVPPSADLGSLKERLQKTVQLKSRNSPMVQCIVGSEDMSTEQVADNVLSVYNQVLKMLPNEEQNIKTVYLKKSMSNVIKV
jgi:large subunit ribosomal protein L1